MKKLFLLSLITLSLFSFSKTNGVQYPRQFHSDTTVKPVPKYCVSMTVEGWNQKLQWLGYIGGRLKNSDLPSRDVSFIQDSLLVPLQMEIISQIQNQLPKDTVTKKK